MDIEAPFYSKPVFIKPVAQSTYQPSASFFEEKAKTQR
jgi:hypothetical protein